VHEEDDDESEESSEEEEEEEQDPVGLLGSAPAASNFSPYMRKMEKFAMYLLAKILRSYGVLDISENKWKSKKVTYEELDAGVRELHRRINLPDGEEGKLKNCVFGAVRKSTSESGCIWDGVASMASGAWILISTQVGRARGIRDVLETRLPRRRGPHLAVLQHEPVRRREEQAGHGVVYDVFGFCLARVSTRRDGRQRQGLEAGAQGGEEEAPGYHAGEKGLQPARVSE
jgi:hypothetical protein